jgi:hypothetical protein
MAISILNLRNIRPNHRAGTSKESRYWVEGCGQGSPNLGEGLGAGFCVRGNEPSGFIKFCEFLEWLSNCWLVRSESDPWSQLISWLYHLHDTGQCDVSQDGGKIRRSRLIMVQHSGSAGDLTAFIQKERVRAIAYNERLDKILSEMPTRNTKRWLHAAQPRSAGSRPKSVRNYAGNSSR